MRKLAAFALASALLAGTAAEARTVVRIDPNGIKVITMTLPQGVVVIECDRANVPIRFSGPTQGLDLVDLCRKN